MVNLSGRACSHPVQSSPENLQTKIETNKHVKSIKQENIEAHTHAHFHVIRVYACKLYVSMSVPCPKTSCVDDCVIAIKLNGLLR